MHVVEDGDAVRSVLGLCGRFGGDRAWVGGSLCRLRSLLPKEKQKLTYFFSLF